MFTPSRPFFVNGYKTKEDKIEAARGLACLLIVFFHVIGEDDTGLRLLADSPYRRICDILIYIRIPLFTFLSGYIYAKYRLQGELKKFALGKARRLLLPLIFVATTYAVIQAQIPGTHAAVQGSGWLTFLLFPYAHFWFIQAIFIIFILIALTEIAAQGNMIGLMFLFLVFMVGYFNSLSLPNLFAINMAFYIGPFFMAGVFSQLWQRFLHTDTSRVCVVLALIFLMGMHISAIIEGYPISRYESVLGLCIGVAAPVFILQSIPSNRWLIWIGGYSYSIYLYHVFGTASMRIGLNLIGLDNTHWHTLLGVSWGLLLPVIVFQLFSRYSLLSQCMLGVKGIAQKSSVTS